MLQLLEAENPYAGSMREDPSKGPCTMYVLPRVTVRRQTHCDSNAITQP